MQLSINTLLAISFGVLVLVVISVYFSVGSKNLDQTRYQKFTEQCETFRKGSFTSSQIEENYPDFAQYCKEKYGLAARQCVTKYCGYAIPSGACNTLCNIIKNYKPTVWSQEQLCELLVSRKAEAFDACNCQTVLGLC